MGRMPPIIIHKALCYISLSFGLIFLFLMDLPTCIVPDMLDSDAEENTDNLVPGGTGTGARAHAVSAHLVFKPTAQPSSGRSSRL